MIQLDDIAAPYTSPNVVAFKPQFDALPDVNLANFIRLAKEDLTIFGQDLDWSAWCWHGVGQFLKLGISRKVSDPEGLHLHPDFVDFTKAYVRYSAGHWPAARPGRDALQTLRVLERALLENTGGGNPLDISIGTLDVAAEIARKNFAPKIAYDIGRRLSKLAGVLSDYRLTRAYVGTWKNSVPVPDIGLAIRLGAEGEAFRRQRLPDERALMALGTVFARGFDLADEATHPDVYATSTFAILMGYPARGQEVHELPIDLEIERPDLEGDMQYGHRYRSSKTAKATTIKHVPSDWVPLTKQAVERIRHITESARGFARYAEAQLKERDKQRYAELRFYRHRLCPDVRDDQPLSTKQAAAALGYTKEPARRLREKGLSREHGAHTLNSLWLWVLDHLPEGFPYIRGAKNKKLKYSEALFCMHFGQLRKGADSNPISLWMPNLNNLRFLVNGSTTVTGLFERHNVCDDNGTLVRVKTHQIRHLINTLAHDGAGDTFIDAQMINYWSGRDKGWQGEAYNHVPAEERGRRAGELLRRSDGTFAVIELPPTRPHVQEPQELHWAISRPAPKSCADIEMNYRSAVLMTAYGCCEHDWLLEPCQNHKDCLNCKEHYCIKGAGKDDQERLERVQQTLQKVVVQQELAKAAANRGEIGAQSWYDYQTAYRERLEQLVTLLKHPNISEGSIIRPAGSTTSSHLQRVLRATALQSLENHSSEAVTIQNLSNVYRESLALQAINSNDAEMSTVERGHA
jgi:hypothetical protein